MYQVNPISSPGLQYQRAKDYKPGLAGYASIGARRALMESTFGLVYSSSEYHSAAGGQPLTREEWQSSEWHREGLEYQDGMTREWAEILAERSDLRELEAFYASRGGAMGTAAMLGGGFVGSLPDPLNFIPILGWAGKAAQATSTARMAARVARIAERVPKPARRMLTASGEAAIGVGALQPFVGSERELHQDPWNWQMAAANVAMAAGIGAGFGAISHALSRLSPEERASATALAMAQRVDEQPVDVSRVVDQSRVRHATLRYMADLEAQGKLPRGTGRELLARDMAEQGRLLTRAEGVLRDLSARADIERPRAPVTPREQLAGLEITDEMRSVAADFRRTLDGLGIAEPEALPGSATARNVQQFNVARLRREYTERMAEVIRASDPEAQELPQVRMSGEMEPDEMTDILNAFERQYEGYVAEAEPFVGVADVFEARLKAAMERGLDEENVAESFGRMLDDPQARRELLAAAQAKGAMGTEDIRWDVFAPAEEPLSDAQPLRAPELHESEDLDDAVTQVIQQQYDDLVESGEITRAGQDEITNAEDVAQRLNRMSRSIDKGAACLLGRS